ncbi:uncharacterized protein LOC136067056 [Quercus suber]|uniref:uncharacterized protein LOC136067056 n=1 Tax=Quercus suber TaxID=58331 RepID=UPI0032E03F93
MDRSQSLNVPPYFDGSNYAFWKVQMRAFLCSIDDTIWDVVEIGWTKLEAAKSTWDKAVFAAANANSKALNAIFCGVSPDEFHRISYITVAKEAWEILETTYEGTKKVKDIKLQMLTTKFEELKMGDDEPFDSFYGKLNEIVIAKLNLGVKIEDTKLVRKILRSLPESFRAKVTAIEESKDLDEIKIQELIGSLQTYELGLPSHKTSKSLALKTITKRMNDSSEEDEVEKEVAFLAKNFRKFLKMKNSGKPFNRRKFSSSNGDRKEFKKKEGKDSQSPQGIVCYECNGQGHLRNECPNYLRGKSKAYATTLSDSDSSDSESEESCDGEGNFSAFMTITHVEFSDDLGALVKELGEHFELELIGIVEESEDEEDGEAVGLQETYNSLLEKTSEYAKVANAAIKKMKRAKGDYRSLLVRYKETKCEVEKLNAELSEAYLKIRFLEHEVVQANAKIKRVSTKKLDDVISSQKHTSEKSGLGYIGESSSAVKISKEMKFVEAKESGLAAPNPEKVENEKRKNVAEQRVLNKPRNQFVVKPKAGRKSLPRSQRGPRTNHFCHHCGQQGHTRPNCHKLRALKNATEQT